MRAVGRGLPGFRSQEFFSVFVSSFVLPDRPVTMSRTEQMICMYGPVETRALPFFVRIRKMDQSTDLGSMNRTFIIPTAISGSATSCSVASDATRVDDAPSTCCIFLMTFRRFQGPGLEPNHAIGGRVLWREEREGRLVRIDGTVIRMSCGFRLLCTANNSMP